LKFSRLCHDQDENQDVGFFLILDAPRDEDLGGIDDYITGLKTSLRARDVDSPESRGQSGAKNLQSCGIFTAST